MENNYISVEKIIRSIKKGWIFILAVIVVSGLASVYVNLKVLKDTYQSNAKLFVGKEINDDVTEYNQNDVTMYQKLLATYGEVILSRDLIESAIKSDRLEMNVDEVLSSLTVNTRTDTQIIDLYYVSNDKKQSKKVLDAIISEFMIEAKELIPNSNIKIITKPQEPIYSIGPNRKENVIKAVLIGGILAVAIVVVIDALDNRVISKEDIEEILDTIVLGSLPEYSNKDIKKDIKRRESVKKCYIMKNTDKGYTQNVSGK